MYPRKRPRRVPKARAKKRGKRFFKTSFRVLRQGRMGPTPMRRRIPAPRGAETWLKKGAPTLTLAPLKASTKRG